MSVIFNKYYKQIFKELITSNGFKQKGVLFYKVVNNQIVQTICLENSRFGNSFTLNIGVLPFCVDITDLYQIKMGTFRIGELINHLDTWWDYNPSSTTDMELAIKSALYGVKEKAIPLFEITNDYRSYINNVDEIEKDIYGEPLDNSDVKLWVNIKLQNYERAINIINRIESQNLNAAAANRNIFTDEEYKEYKQKIESDLCELREIRSSIQNKHTDFLESLLCRNEEVTRNTLIKFGLIK